MSYQIFSGTIHLDYSSLYFIKIFSIHDTARNEIINYAIDIVYYLVSQDLPKQKLKNLNLTLVCLGKFSSTFRK